MSRRSSTAYINLPRSSLFLSNLAFPRPFPFNFRRERGKKRQAPSPSTLRTYLRAKSRSIRIIFGRDASLLLFLLPFAFVFVVSIKSVLPYFAALAGVRKIITIVSCVAKINFAIIPYAINLHVICTPLSLSLRFCSNFLHVPLPNCARRDPRKYFRFIECAKCHCVGLN